MPANAQGMGTFTPWGPNVYNNPFGISDTFNRQAAQYLQDKEKYMYQGELQKQLAEMKYKYDYDMAERNRQFAGMRDIQDKQYQDHRMDLANYYQYGY